MHRVVLLRKQIRLLTETNARQSEQLSAPPANDRELERQDQKIHQKQALIFYR